MSLASADQTTQEPIPVSASTARRQSHVRTIIALMLREMSSKYGNRPGGYVWAVLEPMSMILMLAFAFSLLLRSPSLGNSFILFYGSGFLPFIMFRNIVMSVQNALSYSKPLMIYPIVHWVDAIVARFILALLTNLVVSFLLLTGILITQDTHAVLVFGPIVEGYLMTAFVGLGVGLVNGVMMAFYPVWKAVWGVMMRPLAIASGVILIYENLPGFVQDIIWYNPMLHALGLVRKGIYPNYEASYVSHAYVATFALGLIAFGLMLHRRYYREMLSR